jgi:hypothetical protein
MFIQKREPVETPHISNDYEWDREYGRMKACILKPYVLVIQTTLSTSSYFDNWDPHFSQEYIPMVS